MERIDGIPVYEACIESKECGMLCISLVDSPAVESDFLAFGKQEKKQSYAIQDEDRHLVCGVVMRADFPIYRNDIYGEYYVVYRAETIRLMAEKYLEESRQNHVNLMHDPHAYVQGVNMVQFFIKDTAAGIVPSGFDDIADGSLFAEFHINDPDVWAEVKEGKYKGFSLEGLFSMVEARTHKAKSQKSENMSKKLQEIRARLAALLGLAFGSVTTDRGIIQWDGDEDLKAGTTVYSLDEAGERVAVEDGTYKTEDGKAITVKDGKVEEIVDDKAEVDAAAEDEVKGPDGSDETDSRGIEELRKEVNELYALVDKILDAMGMTRTDMKKMSKDIEDLKKRPAAKPAQEEFKQTVKVPKTGNARLDRLAEILL
ncbi:MAG: XkdF-like putative serine protease domain-containing protein [Bacteroidales bacterium]|nr:XkdF-like putative serine protease domain-containing protein [Bacteroidales bacterium]